MQYIPQKNIKSATAAFADSLLIVCYELSYPHFMERRGSLYFSSEHTAYSPVNLGYLCEAINDEFINHVRGCRNALPKLTLHLLYSGIQSFLGSLLFRVFRSGSSVGSFSRVWF